MPVGAGRKGFIYNRQAYYRDYYQKNKAQYVARYERKKEIEKNEANLKEYYASYYKKMCA